jgi:hypothetical protein
MWFIMTDWKDLQENQNIHSGKWQHLHGMVLPLLVTIL